jgi:hypothetical protein
VLEHGGSVEGFVAHILAVPSRRFAAAAVVNADSYGPGEALYDALEVFTGGLPGEGPPGPRPDAAWGRYEGEYLDPYGDLGRLRVARAGASLTLTFDDGERVAMAPYGLDQFAFTARRTMGYEVSALFFATADGRPEFLATRIGVARWVR